MTPRLLLIITILAFLLTLLFVAEAVEQDSQPKLEQVHQWGRVSPPYVVDGAATSTTQPRARTAPTKRTVMRAASASPPVVLTGEPSDAQFDTLAGCESGGRWDANTGNGYYGGLQFDAQTWHANGGTGLPHEHTRLEQIDIARRVWRARGWQPWPSCSRQLGWR